MQQRVKRRPLLLEQVAQVSDAAITLVHNWSMLSRSNKYLYDAFI